MEPNHLLIKLLKRLGLVEKEFDISTLDTSKDGVLLSLSKMGLIDTNTALPLIASQLGIDYWDLEDSNVKENVEVELYASRVNPDFCWSKCAVPLCTIEDTIVVGTANPLDRETLNNLEFSLGQKVMPVLAEETILKKLLATHLPTDHSLFDTSAPVSQGHVEIVSTAPDEEDISAELGERPPIIKLTNGILIDAVKAGASDIHLEPSASGLEIRFRVDGVMKHVIELPKRLQPYVLSRFKLLSGMDISIKRRPQDGRFRARLSGERVDVRVSSVPTTYGEKLVLRVLQSDARKLDFSRLGLPTPLISILKRCLEQKHGLILVTGPTGSGKTTTLYACMNEIRNGTKNIETVEDPIEYRLPGIQQIQVNETTGVTFASALRSVLRQDPDVIMVGEIRDGETAQIALQAAQTGHIVLSTLHTNDAPSAITRLKDLGCEQYAITSGLKAVLAQRLIRTLCKCCKRKVSSEECVEEAATLSHYHIKPENMYAAVGCDECSNTGYRGRVGVFSFLEMTQELEAELKNGELSERAIQIARKRGYEPLDEVAAKLVANGDTSLEEIKPYLPLQQENALATATKKENPLDSKESSSSGTFEKQKILIIDDDADVRNVLEQMLALELYEVTTAVNGRDGLEQLFEKEPDLILLDLNMPQMNGRDFLLRLRSHPKAQNIPVVVLTAIDTEVTEEEMLELGARDFVGKASSRKVLLSRVRNALNR